MPSGPWARRSVLVMASLAVALLLRTYVAGHFVVRGESMLSTLADGDRMLVDRVSYRLREPRRGEVVIVATHQPEGGVHDLVKRVIAVGGETIQVQRCVVYIDGAALDEPYLDAEVQARDGCGTEQAPVTVPDGQVYVMGDHRGRSNDSRFFGPIPDEDLVGRVVLRIWPPRSWGRVGP